MDDATILSALRSATHPQFIRGMLERCRADAGVAAAAWRQALSERQPATLTPLVDIITASATRATAMALAIELLVPGSAIAIAARQEATAADTYATDATSTLRRRRQHLGVTHA